MAYHYTLEGQKIILPIESVIVTTMDEDEKFKEEVKNMIDGVLGLVKEETE
jgi:hypothetical protein